ncbi:MULTISPECIES: sulfur carrier protein ThiS [Xanthocytophaga]|uniref:Sulfur carrier protein ThiS n=2 Tax=Xanthocytophaga TaxID=3078918 RepID=A0AAE3QWA6_9BACT|nr:MULTISPECIES: sulfur carrier protein ThiS [Xanthocytophaga]MDJ1486201.1 sulfur carrier protein ThiS [Xanthocytophaga flavus]MDJ1501108.1 sulfur carrier protein ThiS [Xanthocytophaga agilis]
MDIILNQESKTFPDNCTVQQLMDIVLPDKQKGVAVAINQAVIPRPNWGTHTLHPNDNVLLIKATQGG